MGWEMKVDVDYWEHPKTYALVALIGEGADSYPPKMWAWACKFQKDGKLHNAQQVELACKWKGKPGELSKALMECGKLIGKAGFIDEDYSVHNWAKRMGRDLEQYEHKKEYNKNFQAGRRAELPPKTPKEPKPALPENLPSSKIGLLINVLQNKKCPNAIETLRKFVGSWVARKGFEYVEKTLNNMPEGRTVIEIQNEYFNEERHEKGIAEIMEEKRKRESERVADPSIPRSGGVVRI